MKVPYDVAKFCCVEAASVAALAFGSTSAASMTLGLLTSRKESEQALAPVMSAAPIRAAETARVIVVILALSGGLEGEVEPNEPALGCRQREEVLPVEVAVLRDDLGIGPLVLRP